MNSLLPELLRFKEEWAAIWLDEDLDRRKKRKAELIEWKTRLCAEDERPLVEALRANGFLGSSVWELVNTRNSYPELIQTLREHSSHDYLPPIREGIFRALMVKDGQRETYDVLKKEWQRGTGRDDKFLRWALAYAISYAAKKQDEVLALADLLEGDEYADDPFVRRLKKSARGRDRLAARTKELVQ